MAKALLVTLAWLLFTVSILAIGYCLWWWTPIAGGIFWGLVGLLLSQALYNSVQKGG